MSATDGGPSTKKASKMDAATLELLELADPANWETKRKSAPPKQSYQAWSKQFNPRKGRHAQKGGKCGKTSGSTTGRRLKKNDRRRLQQLATALARRVLVQDEQQKEALQQARELKHQVAELEAWKRVVTIQAREEAKERQVVQKRLAEREASVFKREQRVRAREAAVESRMELLHTIDALERELARVKKANRVEDHVNDEVQRRYRRLDQELGFAKQEVRALEGTFVEHLYDLFKLRVDLESKSVRDDDLGTTRRRNEKAREDLQARLRIACAEGGENSGTGLGIIAAELLQAVQVSYGRAADYAEEMRMENVQLDDECSTLRERLTHTLDENALNKRKLRSEELNLQLMQKRLRCLQEGEARELRSMLEHSQKEYMQLRTMLNEYLVFSQEEMRKSLGFVPKTVQQVATVCANASPDPLDNYVSRWHEAGPSVGTESKVLQ